MSNHKTQRSDDMTLGPVVLSYPTLFTPKPIVNGAPKFSVNIIMDPNVATTLNQAAQALALQAFPGGEYQQPTFQWPFMQVEQKTKQPHYAQKFPGHFVASPKSSQEYPPQVVDHERNPLIDRSKIFPGAKAYVIVNLYSYSEGNNTGIGIGLSAVMVWGEGEPLQEGGSVDINKGFGGINVTPVAAPIGTMPAQPAGAPLAGPMGVVPQQPASAPVPQAAPVAQPQAPMPGPMGQAQFGQPGAPGSYQQSAPQYSQPGAPVPQSAPQQAVDPTTGLPIAMPTFN